METLKYVIDIAAPAEKVWITMLEKETYEQWSASAWPGSRYEGRWALGEQVKFIGTDGAGTLAEITEFKPNVKVLARHIGLLGPNGKVDKTSDAAKSWIGTLEGYEFQETNGKTKLTVTIETNPEWREMFDNDWPRALEDLKKLAEEQYATAH